MVESNGQTLPVAWQQVNDPQLSAMVADYQASQQMPEPEMYADNTRMTNVGNDVATDATLPPPRSADADVRGQFSQAARAVQNRPTTQELAQAMPDLTQFFGSTPSAASLFDSPPAQTERPQTIPARATQSQQPDNGRPRAQLVVPSAPQPAPRRLATRRPAQGPQLPARPMTDDEFLASVDQRRSRPGGPNNPRQVPTVADTAQSQIANMRGLSDGQRELLSAQLAPLSAAEDTVRAQQQAETEQRNAIAGLGVSRMIDQEESRMRRQEREDRDRKFEETYAKERADLSADSYWKDKGIGMQVLAAISAGLGAMGASLNGGPNYALEIINGAIDRDIALKREAIGTKEDNLKRERTRFEDDEQWALAERMRGYEVAEQQIEMLGAGARTAQQRQAAVELQSQMRGLVAQTREQVRIDNARRAAAAAREQARAAEPFFDVDYGNGLRQQIRRSDSAGIERAAKLLGVAQPGEQSAPAIPSSLRPTGRGPIPSMNATASQRLNQQSGATRSVLQGIDNLRQIREEVGSGGLNGETLDRGAVARAETARKDLLLSIKSAAELGALDNGMMQFANDLIRDPTEFSLYSVVGEDPVMAGLNELRSRTLQRANSQFGEYNLEFNENNADSRSADTQARGVAVIPGRQ